MNYKLCLHAFINIILQHIRQMAAMEIMVAIHSKS
jgi:hypothetical protein